MGVERKNNLRTAKHLQEESRPTELPKFEAETVEKLKKEINSIVRIKKGLKKK